MKESGLPSVPVLAGSGVGVPRCSGTKWVSEKHNPVCTEKYNDKLRLLCRDGGSLTRIVHRSSAVERSWSLQQLLVARSVTCGQGGMTDFSRSVCGFLRRFQTRI